MSTMTIEQGATFQRVYRWGAPPVIYVPITDATNAAPCVLHVPDHGVPDGWRIAVASVRGMVELNAKTSPPKPSEFVRATVVDADHIELNSVNSLEYGEYESSGTIMYYTPVDLTDFSARLQIRRTVNSEEAVLELTSDDNEIELDNTDKTITVIISAEDTAGLDFPGGVFQLEMVDGDGKVTRLDSGAVKFSKEVTR